MKYKPYPGYKPSGIDWIGDIPVRWGICKLKYLALSLFSNVDKHSKEGEYPVRLCNYVDVYYNDLIMQDMNFMNATANKGEIKRFTLNQGDVLITKDSESWDDIAIPAYASDNLEGVLCGYHLAMIRANKGVYSKYLFWSFLSECINHQFKVSATGVTRYGLGKGSIDGALFFLPPEDEQKVISRFLDKKTAQIDELIGKKEEMISLLKEKRAAIINQAVICGLDEKGCIRQKPECLPASGWKPSGIDWIGGIPEEWEISKLKYMVLFKSGETITSLEFDDSGDFPVYGGNGLRGYTYTFTHDGVFVLIGRQGAHCGNVHFVRGRFWASEHAVVSTMFSGCDERWFYYLVVTMNLNQYSVSAAQPGLAVDQIQNLSAGLPNVSEQRLIADFLDKRTSEIDNLIKKIEEAILKLHEYRSSLIIAAVTGKIDVRKKGKM